MSTLRLCTRTRHTLARSAAAVCAALAVQAIARSAAAQQPARAEGTLTGTALVANQGSASATIVDAASQRAKTIEVGTGPHEAAISPDGRWGVVTIYGDRTPGNRLAIIDLADGSLARHIELGDFARPHGAVFVAGSNSLLAVTSEAAQRLLLVDIAQGRVMADIPTEGSGSHMVGLTADGTRAYTANVRSGSISELDLAKRAFVRQLAIAPATEGIAVRPDGKEVWVGSNEAGTVSVVDTRSWSVAATIEGFGVPYRIAISPDGTRAVVCDPKGDKIHIIDVATRKIVGDVGGLGSPRGVIIAPDNRTAFVTAGEAQAVLAIDLVERRTLMRVPVGVSPDGVGYNPHRAGQLE
jgi:YVTN family beta-propeller protein